MSRAIPSRVIWIGALIVSASLCGNSRAQLGSIQTTHPASTSAARAFDQSSNTGALRSTTTVDDGGTTIRAYTTANDQIVAYTWNGPVMPDLHKLLGTRFEAFQSGAANSPNRHAIRVMQSDFVVESSGQMRGYIGRAWLPNALPPSVAIDDLR